MTNAGIGPSTRTMPAFVRFGVVLVVLASCDLDECPVTHGEGNRVSQHAFTASFDPAAGRTLLAWGEDRLQDAYSHTELHLGFLDDSGGFAEAPDPEITANPVASYGTAGGHLVLLFGRGWVVVDSTGRIASTVPLRSPGDAWAVQGVPGGFLVAMNSGEARSPGRAIAGSSPATRSTEPSSEW